MYLEAGLLTRRSIRKFQPGREIPQQDVEDILKIAMYAPSAHNNQPWEFVVVNDKNLFAGIMDIHPYAGFLKDASLAILVCGNTQAEYAPGFWITDTSAAIENLLLACHGRGLGACWCGIYPNEERAAAFRGLFGLPEHINPNGLIVIGYPEKIPQMPRDRYKPEKIHYNQW